MLEAQGAGAAKLHVFIDADVLFAGAASPSEHSASLVILRIAELTIIDAVCTEQVVIEAERNLASQIPLALPAFRLLVSRCLRVVPDPEKDEVLTHVGLADPKDLPLLVAALRERCSLLTTFNIRHFRRGRPDVETVPPGVLVRRIRDHLVRMPLI